MCYGISIYVGLDNTLEENILLLEEANKRGIRRVFTSLHIPEANYNRLKEEFSEILKTGKKYNMDIICDISPNTFKFLGLKNLDLKAIKDMGIQTIRIDFGYDEREIAKLTHNEEKIKIQLNASTISEIFLENLEKYKADFSFVDALHNFYPRRGTAISEETLIRKNIILKKKGIRISAFVSSNNRRRSPLKEGLPTMEDHREMEVSLATRHLFALGIDSVFIGDSLPSIEELNDLSSITLGVIEIKAKLRTNNNTTINLLNNVFTSRDDEARDAIRAQESRIIIRDKIYKENNFDREYGDITVDNIDYQRYMGEVQIIKRPQKGDSRVNNVAKVIKEEEFLLKYIVEGKKFSFKFI